LDFGLGLWTWTVCWKLDFNWSGYLDDTGLKEKKKLTDIGFYGFSDLGISWFSHWIFG